MLWQVIVKGSGEGMDRPRMWASEEKEIKWEEEKGDKILEETDGMGLKTEALKDESKGAIVRGGGKGSVN